MIAVRTEKLQLIQRRDLELVLSLLTMMRAKMIDSSTNSFKETVKRKQAVSSAKTNHNSGLIIHL